ncbi:MAG TPA: 16S rRNA (guanine(966)-N(2))-methyltransferase RsmD [Actinobacteria bacterium]|nr:16S rRNA (guanine(966)-N(2))-methyltransferase RsmD [Actinomycetota bacterium]
MRVISGTAKGRRLSAPKGQKARPTSDRVKESLFSILNGRVIGSKVLDLYAGTGALGIEALSRGAASAFLVDNDALSIEAIKRNLLATGFEQSATVCRQSSVHALDRLIREKKAFDLIFLDPPYRIKKSELEVVIGKAAECLSLRGLMVLEHQSGLLELDAIQNLISVDERRYGDTGLSLFEKREN